MVSHITNPKPVKLFVGMLSSEVSLFEKLKDELENTFGHVDLQSPVWEWAHTDYYAEEMGTGLKRKFIFFQRLINPESISEIKLKTVEFEKQYLNPPLSPLTKGGIKGGCLIAKWGQRGVGGRRINLDPGYLDSAKIVLVSTKDYSHRICLGKGIYGEVTLIYSGKDYQILPYTYPDFRTQEYLDIFKKARELYKAGKNEISY
ncbi:MAG: DUF4416 family protein [Nitrospirae bacterium]|nr:DUF4416 family protein [Nitrospirota bacterium]